MKGGAFGLEVRVWEMGGRSLGREPGASGPAGWRYYPFRSPTCAGPKGRKGYRGRMERPRHIGDEEFLIPSLAGAKTTEQLP